MKKQRKKRLIALAMSAMMILSLTQNVAYNPYANDTNFGQVVEDVASTTDALSEEATTTVESTEMEPVMEIQDVDVYGETEPEALDFMGIVNKITITPGDTSTNPINMSQQFSIKMNFTLPEDSALLLEDNYIYSFDLSQVAVKNALTNEEVYALIAASSTSTPLPIVMGNVQVGTYTIVNGVVTLNFKEGLATLVGDPTASRTGDFQFNCGLDEDKLSDDGGTYVLKFSTKENVTNPEITVNPKQTIDAGVDVAKSDATFDAENMTATYTITVTNNNDTIVNNVVIKDSMGTYLSLDAASVTTNNGATVTPTKDPYNNYWNFSIQDLPAGTTTITYTCNVDDSVMIGANNALGSSNGLDNTVSAKVGDRDIYIDADNKTTSQSTNFNVYKDVVSKDVAVSGDTVTWTIVINAGSTELDLDGYTFTDTLDSRLTYDANSVTVTSTVPNDPNVAGLEAAIEGLDSSDTVNYVFPAGSTGEYTITYTTTVPEHAGIVKYNNTAKVTNPDGEPDTASKDTPGIGDEISSKAYDGADDHNDKNDLPAMDANDDLILDWKTTVAIPQGADSFVYNDYVKSDMWENGLGFVEDSLVVTAVDGSGNPITLEEGVDYSVPTYSTSGTTYNMDFSFTQAGMNKINADGNSKVYIEYSTIGRYHDRAAQDWQKYRNHYNVTVGSISENGDAEIEKYYQESQGTGGISKTAAVIDEDAHTITWQVTVDPGENNTLTNLKLVDTVNDMSYAGYASGGNTYSYNPDAGNTKMVALIRTSNYALYEIPMTLTTMDDSVSGHPKYTYTIDFSNATLTQLSSYGGFDNPAELDQKIDIFYTTKITGDYLLYNNYDTEYTNTVVATENPAGTELEVGESTVTKTMDTEILTKDCLTEDGQPTSMLEYSINVNPDGLNLNPSANYFVVEDDLPDSLIFMTDGTVVKDAAGNVYSYASSAEEVKNAGVGSHIYHVSYENSVLMFTVPDEAALTITYKVNMLMDTSSGSKQYINSVKIEEPYVAKSSSNSSDVNRRISSSSATIYSILFKVEKVNSQDITERLGGATFQLDEYAYENGAWSTTPTNTYTAETKAGQLLKDTDFVDANNNHPQTNRIYVLSEIEAPYGYEKTDQTYTFIILEDDANGTWAARLNGRDDVYRIMGNSTFVFSNMPSTTFVPNKLTITKEYYQANGTTPATVLPADQAVIQIFDQELTLAECQTGNYTPLSTGDLGNGFTCTEVYNSTDGHVITLDNIPDGTYTVYEKNAPTGYDILERVYTFTVDNGKVKWEADAEDYQVSATLKNKETYDNSITINKRYFKASDSTKANPLTVIPEQAVFTCTNTVTGQTVAIESVAGSEGFVYKMTKLPAGTYELVEKASDVYDIDSPLPYTITVSDIGVVTIKDKNDNIIESTALLLDNDANITIDNVIKDNSITINKKYFNEAGNQITSINDFTDSTNPQKVEFILSKSDGVGGWTVVSDMAGLYESFVASDNANWEDSYKWTNLEPGDYKIEEKLKSGDTTKYEPVADTYFTVADDYSITIANGSADVYTASVDVNNKLISGDACRLYINKKLSDQSGNTSIATDSDVSFKLTRTDSNGTIVEISDTYFKYNQALKRWESTNLGVGTYTLTEETTKNGYVKVTGTITFIIVDNGNGGVKVERASSSGIDDSDITIATEKDGTVETIVIDLVNRPYENSITVNKEYYQPDGTTAVTTVPNLGAEFTLYSVVGGNETEIETLSGATTYKFDKLEPGSYVIKETKIPTGYTGCEEIEFTVDADYKINITSANSSTVSIGTNDAYEVSATAKNKLSNEFSFSKQYTYVDGTLVSDTVRADLFNDTTFELYDIAGNPVTSPLSKTNNTVTITNLNDGTYTIKETDSPTGFTAAGDITLVVSGGRITASYGGANKTDFTGIYGNGGFDVSATLYNRQSENKLTITKKYFDADGNALDISQVAVKASFSIKDANGKIATNYTFNPNAGTYTFKNFVPGTYTITESVPSGFNGVSSVTFTVNNNGQITFTTPVGSGWSTPSGNGSLDVSLTADNEMKPNKLYLTKVYLDMNGNIKTIPATKAEFTLENVNGFSEVLSYTNGIYSIDNLMPGTYELIESTLPSGYMPLTGKITVTVATDGTISANYTGGDADDFHIVNSGTLTSASIELKNHEVTNLVSITKSYISATDKTLSLDSLEDDEYATFKLYQNISSTKEVEVTNTDKVKINKETGVYAFANLDPGYYTIKETPGVGFEDENLVITFRVTDEKEITSVNGATATSSSNDYSKYFEIVNKREPFDNKLTLTKAFINQGGESITGTDYDTLLGDVTFKMYDEAGSEVTGFAYDSNTDSWVVEHLEPGDYIIKETDCPDDFVKAGDIEVSVVMTAPTETTITATYTGNLTTDMVVTQDAQNLAYIELDVANHQKVENYFAIDKKYMDAFGDEITDAELVADFIENTEFVYKAAGSTVETSMPFDETKQQYVLEDLQTGTYTITEVAPDGFIAISDIILTVATDGSITVTYGGEASDVVVTDSETEANTTTAVVYNYHESGSVNIGKYDIVSGDELPGAKLTITDKDGNVIDEWTSTESVHKIDVSEFKAGKEYTLTEVTAPFGYELAESIVFKLDIYGNVYIKDADGNFVLVDDNTIAMQDAHKYVNISKVDITNDEELPGAKLTVKDSEGNVIDEWTSTSESHQISMTLFEPDVEYTLTEVTAPDGYEVAESIVFKLDEDGNIYVKDENGKFQKVEDGTVVMKDSPVEEEEPETPETPETPEEPQKPDVPVDSPDTSDKTPIIPIIILMIISALGILAMRYKKKYA